MELGWKMEFKTATDSPTASQTSISPVTPKASQAQTETSSIDAEVTGD